MSNTRREQQRKDEEEVASTTATKTAESASVQQHQIVEEQRQPFNRAIDETRDHIRKATDEARSQIPRYTQAVNQYQEQTIQIAREVADNFLESQKEIVNSIQSSWVPAIEKVYGAFWNYWTSPIRLTDIYARAVSSFAATKLVNNNLFSNLDAFRICAQNTRDNLKEVSRINVNAAKAGEQTSRDASTAKARSVGF